MTYLNKVLRSKPKIHKCNLPNIESENLDAQTIWQCNKCKKIWRVGYSLINFPEEKLIWYNYHNSEILP